MRSVRPWPGRSMAEEDLPIRPGFTVPGDEIEQTASRSSGPGGQHVNKSETRVSLRWNVRRSEAIDPVLRERLLNGLAPRLTRDGEIVVHADRERSRKRNREAARSALAALLFEASRVRTRRRPTRPTRAAKQRRRDAKTHRSGVKRGRAPIRENDD